jgi:hypothetical protein
MSIKYALETNEQNIGTRPDCEVDVNEGREEERGRRRKR